MRGRGGGGEEGKGEGGVGDDVRVKERLSAPHSRTSYTTCNTTNLCLTSSLGEHTTYTHMYVHTKTSSTHISQHYPNTQLHD